MGKPDQESAAAEEARRATGDAAGRGREGTVVSPAQARDGAASAARRGSRVRVAGTAGFAFGAIDLVPHVNTRPPGAGCQAHTRKDEVTATAIELRISNFMG